MRFLYQQFWDNFCHYRQQFDASFPGFILQSGRELWIGWRVAASLMQLTAIVTANNTNNTSPVCLSTVNCFLFSNCIWLCAVCWLSCVTVTLYIECGEPGLAGEQENRSYSHYSLHSLILWTLLFVVLDNWKVEWEADDECIWRHLGRGPRQAGVQLPTHRPRHLPSQVEMLRALRHRRCQGISLFIILKNISKSLKNIFLSTEDERGRDVLLGVHPVPGLRVPGGRVQLRGLRGGQVHSAYRYFCWVDTHHFIIIIIILYVKHVVTALFPFQVASCKQVILLRYRGRRIT